MLAANVSTPLNGIFDGLTGLPRVAVAVSGGSDSMALLCLVHAWSKFGGPRDVFALTVEHGLRDGSADEAQQVARWCEALGISHVVLPWMGAKPATGIQAKARQARYDLLAQWCRQQNVPVLMTGHTADDQAETVFMRQQRTDTAKSLAGIWPENEWLGVRVLRPLLALRRNDLREYLKSAGQPWLDDPSNVNPRFERVRVRSELKDRDVAALQNIASISQLSVSETALRAVAWLRDHMAVDDYAVVRLNRSSLQDEAHAVRHDILARVMAAAGDGELPERAGVEAVAEWLLAGRENRRSVNGAIVSARRHVVEVMREPGRIRDRWQVVPASGKFVFDGRFVVEAPSGSSVGPMGQPALLKRTKDVPALAFSALPAVKLSDGTVISAVKSGRSDVSATLCERFRL